MDIRGYIDKDIVGIHVWLRKELNDTLEITRRLMKIISLAVSSNMQQVRT